MLFISYRIVSYAPCRLVTAQRFLPVCVQMETSRTPAPSPTHHTSRTLTLCVAFVNAARRSRPQWYVAGRHDEVLREHLH